MKFNTNHIYTSVNLKEHADEFENGPATHQKHQHNNPRLGQRELSLVGSGPLLAPAFGNLLFKLGVGLPLLASLKSLRLVS